MWERGRARYLVVAGMAVSAILVVGVPSASAVAPEFVPETGAFPVSFTSTSGEGTLETTGGEKVTCKSDTSEGSLTGAKSSTAKIRFKGCSTTILGITVSCTTSGAATEEIVTKSLSGELGMSADKSKAVDDLKGEGAGEVVAEFACAGTTFKVTGSMIGEFPSTETFLKETELVLKQSKGVNEFTSFFNAEWNAVKNVLMLSKNGGSAVQAGEGTTEKLTFERKVKVVKAAVRCASSGEVLANKGRYSDNACTKPKAGGEAEAGEFMKVLGKGKDLGNGTECVVTGEPLASKGRYTDNACTKPKAGGEPDAGEYFIVIK